MLGWKEHHVTTFLGAVAIFALGLAADAVQYADMCIVAMREALERQAKPPG